MEPKDINHSQPHLIWALAHLTANRLLRRKLTWFFLLVGLAPTMMALFWIVKLAGLVDPNVTPFSMYQNFLGLYYALFFVPLLALLLGLGTISEEIESKNITFTLVRPLKRISIVLGRFLGHLIVGCLIIAIGLFACYFSNMLFQFESFFDKLGLVFRATFIMCFGFMGYLGMVALLGTLMKRMAILVCIFWIVFDVIFSRVPVDNLQAISIQYRTLASFSAETLPTQFGFTFTHITAAPIFYGFLYCLIFAAICCALMTWRISSEILLSDGIM